MKIRMIPNFFIAGVHKCGETVLATNLTPSAHVFIRKINKGGFFSGVIGAFSFLEIAQPAILNTRPRTEARTHCFPQADRSLHSLSFPLEYLEQALKIILWIRVNAPMRSVSTVMSCKGKSEFLSAPVRKEIRANYADEKNAILICAKGGIR